MSYAITSGPWNQPHPYGLHAILVSGNEAQAVAALAAAMAGGAAIGNEVPGASSNSLLWTDGSGELAQSDYLVWTDAPDYRLGVAESSPQETLHVGGSVRIDAAPTLPAINLKFGNTAHGTDSALIQFLEANSYGVGSGAVLCGLGYTNASWGWTENGIIVNAGASVGFSAANIQAGLDAVASLSADVNGNFTVSSTDTTISCLAGTGTRNVVVDANGKLSAP